ncbi:unnamed protein product [Rhizoctonia solani]|uniref:Uncharacterized protein n=1 Tax=Rhizoctonia solani TaxID=456999 RepID=A0A8H2XIW7_9AGAM|nr:unnamed protein product [Rhizoctonia solani]
MSFAPSQPSSNSAIQWSRGARAGGPVLLDFSLGWGKGKVFEWYKHMRSTAVTEIQLRKEFEEPFRHEYILVSLQGGEFCRIDRRGDPNVPTQTLSSNGSDAHDTVHQLDSIGGIDSDSECLVRLQFNGEIDLSFLLLICFNIRNDPKTQRYTLQRFNCYFYSWTITSVLARHSVAWNAPEQLAAKVQLTDTLKKSAVDPIANRASKLSMKCVSAVFMSMLQPRLRRVLRKHFRPTGFIPVTILNKIVSMWMNRNMRPRMESVMRSVAESAMTTTLESTIASLLDSRSSVMRATLSSTLWFDSVHEALRATARAALRDAVWALMVSTLKSANDADITVQQPYLPITLFDPQGQEALPVAPPPPDNNKATQSPDPSKSPSAGARKWRVGGILDTFFVTGADAIADNSYDTAIVSAWGMSGGLGTDAQTYEGWVASWDDLWSTVREHARTEGQAVLRDIAVTEAPDPGRDEVWKVVWEDLESGFEASRPIVRDLMWDTFEFATKTVVDVVSDAMFLAIQETNRHTLSASLNRTKRKGGEHWTEVSHSELQDWIKDRIQKHGEQMLRLGSKGVRDDIKEAMGRVWQEVYKNESSDWLRQLDMPDRPSDRH